MLGSAYCVLSGSETSVDLVVANGTMLSKIRCTKSSSSCHRLSGPVSVPGVPPNSTFLTMKPFDEDDSLFMMAASNAAVTFVPSTLAVVSSKVWTFLNPYPLNGVSGMRFVGTGDDYLMIALVNKVNETNPGVIVKIRANGNGGLSGTPMITYMTMSPMNFVVSRDTSSTKYWTQMNMKLRKGYINAWTRRIGNRNVPANPYLGPGESISPSFIGEYVMTQMGVVATGNPNTLGFDLVCLHFGYGMSQGPEVSITSQFTASKTLGPPFLGVQTARLQPSLMAVAKTSSGYAIVNVNFGSCPMPSMMTKRDPNDVDHRKSMAIEETPLPEITTTFANLQTLKEIQTSTKFPKGSQDFLQQTSSSVTPFMAAANCKPSDCSLDSPGSCDVEHCWGDGASGKWVCCKFPPV